MVVIYISLFIYSDTYISYTYSLKPLLLTEDVICTYVLICPFTAFPIVLKLPEFPCLYLPAAAPAVPQQIYSSLRGCKQPSFCKILWNTVEVQYWVGSPSKEHKLWPSLIPTNLPEFPVMSFASICRTEVWPCKLPGQGARSVHTCSVLVDLKSFTLRGFRWVLCLFLLLFRAYF